MKVWNRRNTIETEHRGIRWKFINTSRSSLKEKSRSRESSSVSSLSESDGESFLGILIDPESQGLFRSFLRTEFSEENLDFWLECEQYRNVKTSRRKKIAAKIFNTYLEERAPKEVNLDAATRFRTKSAIVDPKEGTFDEAQKHIFDLMERDSFRRFMTSYRGTALSTSLSS